MSRNILRRPANETITEEDLVDVAASLQLLSNTLARQLGIKEAEWLGIDKDNKEEIEKKIKVLHHWYKQNPPARTYGDLRKLITTGFEIVSDHVSAMDFNDVISDSVGDLANITDDGTNSLVTCFTQAHRYYAQAHRYYAQAHRYYAQATQKAIELTKENSQLKEENGTFKEQNLKLSEKNNELENENTELKANCSCKRKRKNTNSPSKNQKKIKEYFLPLSEN